MIGSNVIRGANIEDKFEIVNKILNEGCKIGIFNFKEFNYEDERIRGFEETEGYKTCIRYCNPDILIFNNPDFQEYEESMVRLIMYGYNVLIFTDEECSLNMYYNFKIKKIEQIYNEKSLIT